jgi:hypothetical protein
LCCLLIFVQFYFVLIFVECGVVLLLYFRWIFEALYKWFFSKKVDGSLYLDSYAYNSFDKHDIFEILTRFLVSINCITFLFLLPEPLLMRRMTTDKNNRRDVDRSSIMSDTSSFDGDHGGNGSTSGPPRMSHRESEAVQPIMFMRESTVTGRTSKLSVNMSQMGEEVTGRGPTVMLNEVRESGFACVCIWCVLLLLLLLRCSFDSFAMLGYLFM